MNKHLKLLNYFFFYVLLSYVPRIVGQLTESLSPRFLFIVVVMRIYLFVIDDLLTS